MCVVYVSMQWFGVCVCVCVYSVCQFAVVWCVCAVCCSCVVSRSNAMMSVSCILQLCCVNAMMSMSCVLQRRPYSLCQACLSTVTQESGHQLWPRQVQAPHCWILFYSILFCSLLFSSRLCPSTAGSSPLPESFNFVCLLLSMSILLLVAPECHLSKVILVF